ncbi:MAG: transporter substrate-binding domain-containing protein [Bacteroidales bacterium]|nr:transporter substrate-binding domain-containing protein [Bacteroidales bacterium]
MIRLEFIDTKFQYIIPLIAEGKADMAISGITITDERAEKVLFSKPYNNGYTLIVSMKYYD